MLQFAQIFLLLFVVQTNKGPRFVTNNRHAYAMFSHYGRIENTQYQQLKYLSVLPCSDSVLTHCPNDISNNEMITMSLLY